MPRLHTQSDNVIILSQFYNIAFSVEAEQPKTLSDGPISGFALRF